MAQGHGFTEHAASLGGHELVFLSRLGRTGPRFYLSAGIHGDEPAGLLALHDLIRDDAWPDHLNLGICPCLNPQGFERGTRENASGHDLNRDYRTPRRSPQATCDVPSTCLVFWAAGPSNPTARLR